MKRRLYPGTGLLPAVAVVLGGLLLHAVDQMLSFRAGPVPILVTAPVVATLVYLSVRRTPARRAFGHLAWGVGSPASACSATISSGSATSFREP